jgi:hypothetical protein
VNDKSEIKNHEFFADVDWDFLYKRRMEPPINLVDIKQELARENPMSFKEPNFNDRDYQEKNADYNRVKNFTFVRPHSPRQGSLTSK